RLGLSKADELEVDSLDLSRRVLAHLNLMRQDAQRGQPYAIQLPRDTSLGWTAELIAYWERFGDQIGVPTAPVAVPRSLKGIASRAIRVRPAVARRMKFLDVNIVLQRIALEAKERYDLVIATNILVYYDTFEQSLAMANIAAMLKPSGFLLTNNLL